MSIQGISDKLSPGRQAATVQELKPTTVRFDEEMRAELERVAKLGGVSPSDVVRMCVKQGLIIVEEGFLHMARIIQQRQPKKTK